jgi:hypothetical protein
MKRLFGSCTILVLGMAAMPQLLPAQQGPGLDGVWFAVVAPAVCGTFTPIPGAPTFSGLYMYSHDGSLTNEAAFPSNFPQPILQRSSGVGAWKHAEGQTYTAAFRFFRYNPDNSFHALRFVTSTIVRDGDRWFSQDTFQDFELGNNPISPPVSGCNVVVATRVQ